MVSRSQGLTEAVYFFPARIIYDKIIIISYR